MTYVPQPGTIQHKVIAHLQTMPRAAAVPTAVLADMFDHDPAVIREALDPLRHMGVLAADRGSGKGGPLAWRIVSLDVQPPAEGEAEAQPQAAESTPKARKPRAPKKPPAETAEPVCATDLPVGETKPAESGTPAAKRGVRAAIWSSGELAIETEQQEVILFPAAVARDVIAFLRRVEVPA